MAIATARTFPALLSRDVHGLLSRVGNTPLLRLGRIEKDVPGLTLYGKAEWFNPGGSVKDRAALAMIEEGFRSGAFRPGMTLLDATSGNTGIAYALMGSILGFPVRLALPSNVSPERKSILRAYGAELVLTSPFDGTDGAQRRVKEIVAAEPDRWFYPDQYNNDANWRAHYRTTAAEILEQTGGRLTRFVAGLGTSGTFVGTARRLREEKGDRVRLVSVEPDSPLHGLEGLKHMETALVPGIYDPALADERIRVSTEEAQRMVRRLSREEGILVGPSGGAAVVAALRSARASGGGTVVLVLPDGGERYLNEAFWEDATP